MRGLWKELWKSMHAILSSIQFTRRKTSVLQKEYTASMVFIILGRGGAGRPNIQALLTSLF